MTSQKTIAQALDRAAARSSCPATGKQCWYLAGLMSARGEDGSEFVLSTTVALSKDMASDLIEMALKH